MRRSAVPTTRPAHRRPESPVNAARREQPGPVGDHHQAAQIIVRFDDYLGRYVFHCRNLEHEDMAMMANFTVRDG